MVMTPTDRTAMTGSELDAVAWEFLASEFAGQIYADWPIDRRLNAYLLHHGPAEPLTDGSIYDDLLNRVMSNIGPAVRSGVLRSPGNEHPANGSPTPLGPSPLSDAAFERSDDPHGI